MVWDNGNIPAADLVVFNEGTDEDGYWYWALTPATLARHNALVARALVRTGRRLRPGDGYTTYRPLAAQETARDRYGNGAAWPGTSSHGGFWEGHETLAIDYSNWAYVYDGDRAVFYEDCRAVGLTPGMISPERGYPDEPWHVIDDHPREMPEGLTGGFLMALTDAEQAEILTAIRGMLSSQNQVTLFQNVQAIRDLANGSLSSQHQVEVYQTVNTIRDRVDALLAQPAGGVDVSKLGADLAPLLGGLLGHLDDTMIDTLVNRLLAEQAKRLAGQK